MIRAGIFILSMAMSLSCVSPQPKTEPQAPPLDFSGETCERGPSSGGACTQLVEPTEPYTAEMLKQTRLNKLLMLFKLASPFGKRGAIAVTLSPYNFEYHGWTWVRDAALTMRQIVGGLRQWNRDTELRNSSIQIITDYIEFSRKLQDNAGLGEPRFDFDGHPYAGEWGRPQNDGPALRVLTLAPLAKLFFRSRSPEYKALADQLYRAEHYEKPYSILKRDLEFIAKVYTEKCKDIWEESTGVHFYTLMVQRAALTQGAEVARLFKDPLAAEHYETHARKITELLETFWNPESRQIDVTLQSQGERSPKKSRLDIAVILAANHTFPSSGSFSVLDSRVMATALKIEEWSRAAFSINRTHLLSREGRELGPAIGRYPEDLYNGNPSEHLRFTGAHPWVLATLAMGEFYLNVGISAVESGRIELDSNSRIFYEKLLKRSLPKNLTFLDGSKPEHQQLFDAIVRATRSKGLSFYSRVTHHLGTNGTLPEMIDGKTGETQSIPSLGWSDTSAISFTTAFEHLDRMLPRGR